jgi:pimeloyl-ACP methyl ester carboxylesterase
VVRVLPPGHRVVVVDLLGYGRSDRPGNHDVSIRGHADRMVAFLETLGINYACVVGHDVGGGVALSMAIRSPARVSRLCLIDSVAFDAWPSREVKLARAMLPLTRHLPATWLLSILRTDLLRGYTEAARGAHSIERYVRPFSSVEGRDVFMKHLAALDCADTEALTPRLKDIVAPTAILWGAEDPFLPFGIGGRLHAEIPQSSLEVVPGVRHYLPEEAPERVAGVVADLLKR